MKIPNVLLPIIFIVFASGAMAQSAVYKKPYAEFVQTNIWNKATWCGELRVTSPQQELTDWEVRGTVGSVTSIWGGSYEMIRGSLHNVVFRPADWNSIIPVGGTVAIGVCGEGDLPANLEVTRAELTPQPGPVDELKFMDLLSGDYPVRFIGEKQYRLVNTADELTALENIIGRDIPVDISRVTVVGAFMGQRNTGGYSIRVTQAVETASAIVLSVTLSSPGPNCMVTQALTSPYHVIALEKTAKPIQVQEVNRVYNCPL